MQLRRGQRIGVVPEAVPEEALSSEATVVHPNLHDPKVGTYHGVMFNAGNKGVIFGDILDSEVAKEGPMRYTGVS